MNRIALTDDSNTWFDKDRAARYEEDTNWDGRNHISVATGSQFEHEVLYKTARGKWVLNHWSQWQGSQDTWEAVSDEFAYDWLVKNGHADAVPTEEADSREIGANETPKRTIRIPDDLWTKTQDYARAQGLDASKLIIKLLQQTVGDSE